MFTQETIEKIAAILRELEVDGKKVFDEVYTQNGSNAVRIHMQGTYSEGNLTFDLAAPNLALDGPYIIPMDNITLPAGTVISVPTGILKLDEMLMKWKPL